MDIGEIYKIKCPDGKVYIGQCVSYLSNGTKYGTLGRWRTHLTDSRRKNGGNCRKLNEAIRYFGETNFQIEIILQTHTSLLDFYEECIISLLESTKSEFGYNLRSGGNHSRLSLETRLLMRESRLKYTLPKPSQKTKEKISKTLIEKVVRKDADGNILPKYIKYIDWKDRRGYAIVSHPRCKLKYFVSKNNLENTYNKCKIFLDLLNT
jgi:hypothetical protein